MKISSLSELEQLQRAIQNNMIASHEKMKVQISESSPMDFLVGLRFLKTGVDPIKGTELNFVEQLNQFFSDIVIIEATRHLLSGFPHHTFELRLGTTPGFDIESEDGAIVAECFAATTALSNRKLEHDSKKIQDRAKEKEKFLFFYSQNDTEINLQQIYKKYPDIHFVRIRSLSL